MKQRSGNVRGRFAVRLMSPLAAATLALAASGGAALGAQAPAAVGDAPPAADDLSRQAGADAARSFTVRSPFPTLARTKELALAAARRAWLLLDYEAPDGAIENEVDIDDFFAPAAFQLRLERPLPDGSVRTIDITIDRHPASGWEILLSGRESFVPGATLAVAAGPPRVTTSPNPDLPHVDAILATLAAESAGQASDFVSLGLDFAVYQLSYVRSNRALAMLKALGYQTVEYSWLPGETDLESLFELTSEPVAPEQMRLPFIVKLIDAEDQALQERWDSGFGGGTGARAMEQATSGEPQQRLLIVYEPDDLQPVENLFNLMREKIDVPARQVVIEAQVIEVKTDRLQQLGISASGGPGSQFNFEVNPPQGGSTVVFDERGVANDFRVTLSALLTTGEAEILSNPSVLVLDGRQARIEIGERIPVATSESTSIGFSTNVQNERVGIMLNLRPRVSEDGDQITMQVETDVSALIEQITQRDAAGNILFTAPQVDERRVESTVRVSNDTPFIIGGLISSEITETVTGIPILSNIPLIGLLFRRTETREDKREVIVVLTPHVVPADEPNFRFAIPRGSETFDSFGHRLFRNAYRIRDDDAFFDLDSVKAGDEYQELARRVRAHVRDDPGEREHPELAPILAGRVPGEEVLVRRMIWEIIRDTGYGRHVATDRIIFFEDNPDAPDGSGFELRFLPDALSRRGAAGNSALFRFDATVEATLERPLAHRNVNLSYEQLGRTEFNARLRQLNAKGPDGWPLSWGVIVSDVYEGTRTPLELLKDVLVMQRIIALNPTLDLTLDAFRAGRQIIFPTEESLRERFHVIDREAARYFYEAAHYYAAFQAEYRRQRAQLEALLAGQAPETEADAQEHDSTR